MSRLLLIDVATVGVGVVAGAALIAGISDAWWFKVPNWLTYPLILTGMLFHGLLPAGHGWVFSVAGLTFGLVILLPFFLLGGVGAGDVKLLAGIGAWLGLHDVVAVFLVFGALTGVYSAVVMLIRRRWAELTRASDAPSGPDSVEEAVRHESRRRKLVPLATMMAAAILILMVGALFH